MDKLINIQEKDYHILQSYPDVNIADSFVMKSNKIMTGNGEAKLYVGGDNLELRNFFGSNPFTIDCFMIQKDWKQYMLNARDEYQNPTQEYLKKETFESLYIHRQTKVNLLPDKMNFVLIEQKITPPRVYVKSISPYYSLIREVCLPNFSYLEFKKLMHDNSIYYYIRPIFEKNNSRLII